MINTPKIGRWSAQTVTIIVHSTNKFKANGSWCQETCFKGKCSQLTFKFKLIWHELHWIYSKFAETCLFKREITFCSGRFLVSSGRMRCSRTRWVHMKHPIAYTRSDTWTVCFVCYFRLIKVREYYYKEVLFSACGV